jgi:predicted DNA-binding protein YlxM (UPF0122 family)
MRQPDEETLHMSIMFDFFGELLTEKQREYFDLYHNEDLSLSEIAEKAGITRQGVHDILTRAEKTLLMIDSKTGITGRWLKARAELDIAEQLSHEIAYLSAGDDQLSETARKLTVRLESIKNSL